MFRSSLIIMLFNTTIKIKFNIFIERILSTPENILCKLYIMNFILNNKFTIDHFNDVFKQTPWKINPNLGKNSNINFEDSLMNKQSENQNREEICLKTILSHFNQKINNFIDYIIMLGIPTNFVVLKHQCAFIILNIFPKFILKGNIDIFREIVKW